MVTISLFLVIEYKPYIFQPQIMSTYNPQKEAKESTFILEL